MSRVSELVSAGAILEESLTVRKMGLRDMVPMHQLIVRSVDDSFTYFSDEYRAKLRRQHNLPRLFKAHISPKAHFLLLGHGMQDIGYCLLRFQQDRAYIFWMYVDPDFRGIGAGERLLRAAIEQSRLRNMVGLELVTYDKEAFYAKYGFASLRHVAGLVGGVDMVIMEYIL